MLTTVEKVIVLQDVDIFERILSEDLSHIALIAEEVSFGKNSVIYSEGEPSDSMYVVLNGRILLHRDGSEVMVAEEKDVFGSWSLFDAETRVVTATAQEEALLLKIDREDFLDLLTDHSRITQGVLRALVRRLRGLVGVRGPR